VDAFDDLPITDAVEVRAFLARLPLAVDKERFCRCVLGFPHRYLAHTPPVEVVRHFALIESLGLRTCVSSLSAEKGLWRMFLVARDRGALLARLAGSLSFFGVNILEAEAFANESGVVLDSFLFADQNRRFAQSEERRRFQTFLEEVLDGRVDLEGLVGEHLVPGPLTGLALSWDDHAHPTASRLAVGGRDRRGLLFEVTRRISAAACSIDLAHIETPAGEVRDLFYLTRDGARLTDEAKHEVERRLLGEADLQGPCEDPERVEPWTGAVS
jgi:[protein-PII] uridylyltransferase